MLKKNGAEHFFVYVTQTLQEFFPEIFSPAKSKQKNSRSKANFRKRLFFRGVVPVIVAQFLAEANPGGENQSFL